MRISYGQRGDTAKKRGDVARNSYNNLVKLPRVDSDKVNDSRKLAIKEYEKAVEYYDRAALAEHDLSVSSEKPILRIRHNRNSDIYRSSSEGIQDTIYSLGGSKSKNSRNSGINIEKLLESLSDKTLLIPTLALVSFAFALLFSSFSITGFAVSNNPISNTSYVAIGCFVLGLILTSIYLKKKKSNRKKN
jgi:uncharacterized membrane protein (DUF485 family)